MIITAYPRSGSSWFCRVIADALGLFLVNQNMPGDMKDGSLFKNIREFYFSQGKEVSFVFKYHISSPGILNSYDIDMDGKKIHIYRDPRDVMISYFYFQCFRKRKMKFFSFKNIAGEMKDIFTGARRWRPNMFRFGKSQEKSILLLKFLQRFLPKWKKFMENWLCADILSVKYEDLRRNAFHEYKKIFEKLDLKFDSKRLNQSIDKYSIENYKKITVGQNWPEEYRMLRKGIIGDWKNHYNEKHKDFIKNNVGGLLIKLGYENNNDW